MYRGHVNLYRKLNDSGLFSYGLKAAGLFSWLLINVNWKATKWRGEWVYPGQIITSIHNLAGQLSESDKVVRRLINILEAEGVLTREVRANKWSKISLCNWGSYQKLPCMQGKQRAQNRTNRGKDEGQGKGNSIKELRIKNINLFNACWEKFGKYGNEEKALISWSELSESDQEKIKKVIPLYLKHIKTKKQHKYFFENWLKGITWKVSYGVEETHSNEPKQKSFTTGWE